MQKVLHKISSWVLLLVPLSLSISIDFNTKAILLFTIFLLLDYKNFYKNLKLAISDKFVLFLMIIFFIQFIGLSHISNKDIIVDYLERKASFLVLPILTYIYIKKYKINLNKFLKRLSYGILLISLISVINLIYGYGSYNMNFLAKNIPNGHIYTGLYLSFSAIIFWKYFFSENQKILKNIFFYFIPFVLSIIILIIIGSRTALIALIICSIFSIFYIIKINKTKQLLFVCLFITMCVCIFIYLNNDILNRFSMIFASTEKNNPLLQRVIQWNCAINIFKENIFFGVGPEKIQHLLNSCYNLNKFNGHKFNLNSHNQYLDEATKNGILGLITILILYFSNLYYSLKEKNLNYTFFLIIIIIVSFAENIFSRQAGIVFYSFLNSLFFLSHLDKKNYLK